MKNIICIVLLFVFLASCSKNQIEQSLEKYVVDRGDGIDLNYKLEKYYFIDTLTVKKNNRFIVFAISSNCSRT